MVTAAINQRRVNSLNENFKVCVKSFKIVQTKKFQLRTTENITETEQN